MLEDALVQVQTLSRFKTSNIDSQASFVIEEDQSMNADS